MWGPGCWWGPGHLFGGPFGMLIIAGLVFWALGTYGILVFLSRFAKRAGQVAVNAEAPMDIVKRRYARGEIGAEEFVRRKKDLES